MALRSNNPARILKAVVDLMKERYLEKEYEPLNIAEILAAVQLTELKDDLKHWLDGVRTTSYECSFCTRGPPPKNLVHFS